MTLHVSYSGFCKMVDLYTLTSFNALKKHFPEDNVIHMASTDRFYAARNLMELQEKKLMKLRSDLITPKAGYSYMESAGRTRREFVFLMDTPFLYGLGNSADSELYSPLLDSDSILRGESSLQDRMDTLQNLLENLQGVLQSPGAESQKIYEVSGFKPIYAHRIDRTSFLKYIANSLQSVYSLQTDYILEEAGVL